MSEAAVSSADDKAKAIGPDSQKVEKTDVCSLKIDVETAENNAAAAPPSGAAASPSTEVFGNLVIFDSIEIDMQYLSVYSTRFSGCLVNTD